MRSDFELDSNSWDLVITDDIGIVENAAMTSQDSKFSLQLIQGEVFDDNRIGMPLIVAPFGMVTGTPKFTPEAVAVMVLAPPTESE